MPRLWLAAVTAAVLVMGLSAADVGSLGPTGDVPTAEAAGDDTARAVAEARTTGRRVEVVSERGERHEVYANPDGTFTAELGTAPERVRRGSRWVPIDTRLAVRAGGGVGPAAVSGELEFSGGGEQPLIRGGVGAVRARRRP